MNKHEAAEYLGVSVRTLQRITAEKVKAGSYKPKYERGKTGQKAATYDAATLDAWKAELEAAPEEVEQIAPGDEGAPGVSNRATGAVTHGTALARRADSRPTQEFAAMIADMLQQARAAPAVTVSLADKLVLSLKEVSQLTGRSVARLRADCESGRLKAKKNEIARGWRVKRSDLDAYVRKL